MEYLEVAIVDIAWGSDRWEAIIVDKDYGVLGMKKTKTMIIKRLRLLSLRRWSFQVSKS